MTAWLWFSSVPGMAVPGMAQPAKDGTGAQVSWQYLGHVPAFYLDYLDATTGHTLSVTPGNWYSMIVANSRAGLTIPPPDLCWLTPTNTFAPRVVLVRPRVVEVPPPPQVLALDALHAPQGALGRARVRNISLQVFRAAQPAREQPEGSPQYARVTVPAPPSEAALTLAAARARNAELQAARARGETVGC